MTKSDKETLCCMVCNRTIKGSPKNNKRKGYTINLVFKALKIN